MTILNGFYKALTSVVICAFAAPAGAFLIVDNWNLTADSLTFDLHGTVDVLGATHYDSLFIGPADSLNVDWITGPAIVKADITQNGGTYAADDWSGAYSNQTLGDYIYTNNSSYMYVGQLIDLSFSITGTGAFNPSAISYEDIIVTAGYNPLPASLPDTRVITGGAAVPAPSTLVLLSIGLAGMSTRRMIKA